MSKLIRLIRLHTNPMNAHRQIEQACIHPVLSGFPSSSPSDTLSAYECMIDRSYVSSDDAVSEDEEEKQKDISKVQHNGDFW